MPDKIQLKSVIIKIERGGNLLNFPSTKNRPERNQPTDENTK